jgi:cytochrome c553
MVLLPNPRTVFAAVLLVSCLTTPGQAADVANGRKIVSVKCQMCHGMDGQAKLPEAPNLAGQVEQYLVEQMQAFKSGARKNELMTLVVKPLSDAEVADASAYYAAVEVKIGKVPGE